MKASRRRSREFALQSLYQWRVGKNRAEDIARQTAEADSFAKADSEYFARLFNGTVAEAESLEAEIAPLLDRRAQELAPIELAILLLGAYELKHSPEVPYRVVINEAVELAKAYGGTDGYKYVNGVLDKLAQRLRVAERA
ncbi:MAG: transcription antitermination factor NusB [Betaproteobacteria bacterium]|jgi:N utilization substance protein B|nr:transcription antitermination factor NusB [Betaproteobacteria bacterium]